ncbi:TauD/TfdA family dioxygenase [Pseudomonas sp. DTU_2021_1001937_2_SI_NGA_ILE_001]|uniref:TauD/TfdA family dioxygenase n=1 Tax=Pseudomonas sp. DTU_2021_1001937_2_SI_NGA_ILE_001 TaxID=3077589 RepID=UPI0028FC306E|nr:TauD/TfdA family dioxygenase [Pseudomonas sp. DTU_2021_1001937_2_SI_NGA_ILE_001]WNW10410.1 TauD/TfdA family dioxygenase [Pseudomonas sp. DTU_2021_1001937_2_SI_NGA_ILE_001]
MSTLPPTSRSLGGVKRKAMNVAPRQLVSERLLSPEHTLPLVIEPAVADVDLVTWAASERHNLEAKLLQHGALLFRGFGVRSVEQFDQVIAALSPGALEYMFRASPRTRVGGNIYTSTDYPADQMIFPHNEHSYSPRFPLRLFFYCQQPSETGGETPIGSTRAVKAAISPQIEARFREKGVLYVRNYGDGFGLPWQSVFQSEDRGEVEAYCASVGIEVEWKENNRLRTRQRGPAVVRHPRTGEEVWFNHATFFHISTLPPAIRGSLQSNFADLDLPTNTFYGDGEPIEPQVLDALRTAYLDSLVRFSWQPGDVLFIDNMLTVHGREPFTGKRAILTGMAEALLSSDVAV